MIFPIFYFHSSFFFGFIREILPHPPRQKTQGKRHGTIYKIFGMPLKGPRKLFRPPPPTVPWSQMFCSKFTASKKQHLVVSFKLQEMIHFSRKPRESLFFFGESFNLTWNMSASVKFHLGRDLKRVTREKTIWRVRFYREFSTWISWW